MRRAAKEYNHKGYAGLVQQTRAQTTGTLVGLYHSEQAGLDHDPEYPWTTVCEDHGLMVTHASLRAARAHAVVPHEWCELCQKKLAWEEGKIEVAPLRIVITTGEGEELETCDTRDDMEFLRSDREVAARVKEMLKNAQETLRWRRYDAKGKTR